LQRGIKLTVNPRLANQMVNWAFVQRALSGVWWTLPLPFTVCNSCRGSWMNLMAMVSCR